MSPCRRVRRLDASYVRIVNVLVRNSVQGGKNITGGIASGVSGIFTAPVTGAKREGMGGFFKGVGKGLVGAVVKPVVGVTDAAVSVVQVCVCGV